VEKYKDIKGTAKKEKINLEADLVHYKIHFLLFCNDTFLKKASHQTVYYCGGGMLN